MRNDVATGGACQQSAEAVGDPSLDVSVDQELTDVPMDRPPLAHPKYRLGKLGQRGDEELTGRNVVAFLSQAHVEPDLTLEIFFVDGPLEGIGALEITEPD